MFTGMATASRPALTSSLMPRPAQARFRRRAWQGVFDHLLAPFIRRGAPVDTERA
jgi:hypothetical protein